MKTIFISGSISFKKIPLIIESAFNKLLKKQYQILVGDANGIDSLVQDFFKKKKWPNVIVYSIYSQPRVLKSKEFTFKKIEINISLQSKPEREKQIIKDQEMTKDSDISFVIWDGKSNGSYNNILRAIEYNKEIQVFLDNSFLSKEEITKENITNIFNERHEYSLTQYLNDILKKNHQNKIKTTKKMKEILQKKGILISNNSYDNKYEKYITVKNIRGHPVINYKKSLLDDVFKEFLEEKKEQISLF